MRSFLLTGAAGFIGSNFAELVIDSSRRVVVLDALTYAGSLENLRSIESKITFIKGDICDGPLVSKILRDYEIDTIVNFAAESHVDRSIENAAEFVRTNVMGVYTLLNVAQAHTVTLPEIDRTRFRFIQVSTDEVFGELGDDGYFDEQTPYSPNSPYSASKAGGDHLARAWFHTFNLPVIITNCSNNYGPRQFPEKLIPHMINCALSGRPLPVYGAGQNVRDWIHVLDHCRGILLAIEKGTPGKSYCFGGRSERKNLDVVKSICHELDKQFPKPSGESYERSISFVEDRKGHDWRYAIDDKKAERELGFTRKYLNFELGLAQTISWYLENRSWMRTVLDKK